MSSIGIPLTLSYRVPGHDPKQSKWDPLWAALLACPGVTGFALLIGALRFQSPLAWTIGPRGGLVVWAVAFICAIGSFFYFHGRQKSIAVKFCLFLNWAGVIFTVTPPGWIIFFFAMAGVH